MIGQVTNRKKISAGFSLIEVMIVVVIIGIIAAFAIPGYESYMIKTKRADGMGALLAVSNAMEKYRAANMTYVGVVAGTHFENSVPSGDPAPYYNITVTNLTRSTYTLTATPTNSMAGKEGPLTITHSGVRTWTDKDGNLNNCWPESGNNC